MSYYARSTSVNIQIDKKNFAAILEETGKNPHSPDGDLGDRVAELMHELGFTADFDGEGNIDDLWYEYGRFSSADVEGAMDIIAPYVHAGNSIGFVGEDDSQWAYVFKNNTYKECYGITVYPEIAGDPASALEGVEDAHQFLYEIFGNHVDQLDPSIEQEIEQMAGLDGDIAKAARAVLLNRLANSQPSPSYLDCTAQIDALV